VPPVITPVPPPVTNPPPVTAPKTPPVVAANTVTKLSGNIPSIKNANITDASAEVTAKLCIGLDGHVTSAKIIRSLPEIADEMQRALLDWQYKPYVNAAGQPSPACFAIGVKVVFKRPN
jgi:hypothetical protein